MTETTQTKFESRIEEEVKEIVDAPLWRVEGVSVSDIRQEDDIRGYYRFAEIRLDSTDTHINDELRDNFRIIGFEAEDGCIVVEITVKMTRYV